MNRLLEIFSTRELSFLIWIALLIGFSQASKSIRSASSGLIKAFFNTSILLILSFSLGYSATILFFLIMLNLWDTTLIKDAIFWFAGSAFIILFNITKAGKERDFFKNIFLDNIKLILIFEFLVSFHSFSLITEIILLPILVLFGLLSAYAGRSAEHKSVKMLMDRIFVVIGLTFLFFSVRDIIANPTAINRQTVNAFLLPIILTISFLPCAYLIALYMNYEVLFVRLGIFLKKKELLNYAKRRLLLRCNFSLRKLNEISPLINEFYPGSTVEDIRRVIN